MLVAADGVGSAIRRRLMPEVAIIPSPVGALGLFGRSPLTDEVAAELPPAIWNAGFAIVSDGRGTMLGVGHWRPRQPASAAAQLGISASFDDAHPYVMLNGAIPPGVEVPPPADWDRRHPAPHARDDAHRGCAWHPAIRRLVDEHRARHPVLPSVPAPGPDAALAEPRGSRYLGDAINAMLPTLGKGANMSMRNAAVLRDALRRGRPGRAHAAGRDRRLRGRHAGGDLPADGDGRRPQSVRRRWPARSVDRPSPEVPA